MAGDKPKKLILLEKVLKQMSVLVLKKYKPDIVSITGSVGKTSAKEAISCVLSSRFLVRQGEKNYNNEIGIPLTIIGSPSGGRSVLGWCRVFLCWMKIMLFPVKYPRFLILEMGADRPGDIKYLTGFIKSKIGVLTDISGSHLEYFKSLEGVAREKGVLVRTLDQDATAVLNIDNPYIQKIKGQTKAKVITFGFSEEADVRAADIFYNYASGEGETKYISGLSFKLAYEGTVLPMRLQNILAAHSVYAALAAVSAGLSMGLNLIEIGTALSNFRLPPGRMTLVGGIKNTSIIDDSYNASPVSEKAALRVLKEIKSSRKIAVLGDMLELGKDSAKNHSEIIEEFRKDKVDYLFCVGKRMEEAVLKVVEKDQKMKEKIFIFSNPIDAGKKLQQFMREGDLVLVKGSQGMRMEKVVEEVMEEPQKAGEILCRQDKKWKERPFRTV